MNIFTHLFYRFEGNRENNGLWTLVPFQHGFDKLSSCGKLEANLPLQEESNAQKNLHR